MSFLKKNIFCHGSLFGRRSSKGCRSTVIHCFSVFTVQNEIQWATLPRGYALLEFQPWIPLLRELMFPKPFSHLHSRSLPLQSFLLLVRQNMSMNILRSDWKSQRKEGHSTCPFLQVKFSSRIQQHKVVVWSSLFNENKKIKRGGIHCQGPLHFWSATVYIDDCAW